MTLHTLRLHLVFGFCLIIGVLSSYAQTNTILSIQSETTAMETGTYYPLTVYLQDVTDIWQIDTIIEFDLELIFVVGSVSGLPADAGDFFDDEPNICDSQLHRQWKNYLHALAHCSC